VDLRFYDSITISAVRR